VTNAQYLFHQPLKFCTTHEEKNIAKNCSSIASNVLEGATIFLSYVMFYIAMVCIQP
jgi:hypothetical protein